MNQKKISMLLYVFLGFAIGFIFMYFFIFNSFLNVMTKPSIIFNCIIGGVILALGMTIFNSIKLNTLARSNDHTDKESSKSLNLFNEINMLSISTTVLGFLLICFTTLLIGRVSTIVFISLLLISVMIIIYSNFQSFKLINHYFYFSNSTFESFKSLKNDILLTKFDEGEQFVMLASLFKAHQVMTYLLFTLMIMLSCYQSFTHENQMISIISLFLIIITSNYSYYKKSKEFNEY